MASQDSFQREAQADRGVLGRCVEAIGKPLAATQTETASCRGVKRPVNERASGMRENVSPLHLSAGFAYT